IHGDGGIVNDVLNCGTGFTDDDDGDNPHFRCPGGDRTPIDENFTFDIHLPQRPFPGAVLSVEILAGPGNTVSNPALEVKWSPDLDHLDVFGHPDPVIHVLIPLSGSGVDPLDVYARHINAGWVAEVSGLRHVQLTLNTMDMHHDGDNT